MSVSRGNDESSALDSHPSMTVNTSLIHGHDKFLPLTLMSTFKLYATMLP